MHHFYRAAVAAASALLLITQQLSAPPVAQAAQSPSVKSGSLSGTVSDVELQTPQGSVTVALPKDIRGGDAIVGAVIDEPAGTSDGERLSNGNALGSIAIEIAGKGAKAKDQADTQTAGGRALHWKVPVGLAGGVATLVFRGRDGSILGRSAVSVSVMPSAVATSNPAPGEFHLPTVGQTGHPISIAGPFHPEARDASVSLGDAICPILAESPRMVAAQSPSTVVGESQLSVSEGGVSAKGPFRNLTIALSSPNTHLKRGQSSVVHFVVGGLAGLSSAQNVHVTLLTPAVIELAGGATQNVSIGAGTVGSDGTATFDRQITGKVTGTFDIQADVGDDLIDEDEPSKKPTGDDIREAKVNQGKAQDALKAAIEKEKAAQAAADRAHHAFVIARLAAVEVAKKRTAAQVRAKTAADVAALRKQAIAAAAAKNQNLADKLNKEADAKQADGDAVAADIDKANTKNPQTGQAPGIQKIEKDAQDASVAAGNDLSKAKSDHSTANDNLKEANRQVEKTGANKPPR